MRLMLRFDPLLQVPFFLGCMVYNFFPGHMGAAGPAVLRFLVYAGALLQVTHASAPILPADVITRRTASFS